jgi:hypothetical protein
MKVKELQRLNFNVQAMIDYYKRTSIIYKQSGEILKVFKLLREM